MSASEALRKDATSDVSVLRVDMKLEVVVIPVADVDRAKKFYGNLWRRLDADSGSSRSRCGESSERRLPRRL